MKLREIVQQKGPETLSEARRARQDVQKQQIKSLGRHIGEFKTTNQQIDQKLNLISELIKILLAGSVNQQYVGSELAKIGGEQ